MDERPALAGDHALFYAGRCFTFNREELDIDGMVELIKLFLLHAIENQLGLLSHIPQKIEFRRFIRLHRSVIIGMRFVYSSEEPTSELHSRFELLCRVLLGTPTYHRPSFAA